VSKATSFSSAGVTDFFAVSGFQSLDIEAVLLLSADHLRFFASEKRAVSACGGCHFHSFLSYSA
jgi:hypothetical protein